MTLLGLGTYRSRDVVTSATIAAAAGCPLIDTAPAYGKGTHQAALAPVLKEHPRVRIATKIGHMTTGQARAALTGGVLTEAEAATRHSIAPAYVRHQVGMSRAELRRPVLDLVYLHNPDHHNGDRQGLHARIREAFTPLEEARAEGMLLGYGVATWSGFRDGAFTVPELARLAEEAAGDPCTGLAAVQLPVSMVEIDPIRQALAGKGPIPAARGAGWEVWGSAPLHGGDLPARINDPLADYIATGTDPARAALLVAASTPGLTGVLLSTTNTNHWRQAAETVTGQRLSPLRLKDICGLLQPVP
ncbi:aldo/keto reductase [Nocardiopsis lambiniae]|uniref:Aldo/keto reductase n=1 Tax=Nocardiopsis lambiniae TaxID=3075539 RepID=A0ABU2M2V1_9ACTN|nr:aldo/keto reductase [Nocardiopsis sp. DSM 44743]MDT0326974.1 aldo/keto reductase [Nocardiopsis sp. DSM 44743]